MAHTTYSPKMKSLCLHNHSIISRLKIYLASYILIASSIFFSRISLNLNKRINYFCRLYLARRLIALMPADHGFETFKAVYELIVGVRGVHKQDLAPLMSF